MARTLTPPKTPMETIMEKKSPKLLKDDIKELFDLIESEDFMSVQKTQERMSTLEETLKDVAHLFDKRIDAVERLIEKSKQGPSKDMDLFYQELKSLKGEIQNVSLPNKEPGLVDDFLKRFHPLIQRAIKIFGGCILWIASVFLVIRLYDPSFFSTYRLGQKSAELYRQVEKVLKIKNEEIEDLTKKIKSYESKTNKKAK